MILKGSKAKHVINGWVGEFCSLSDTLARVLGTKDLFVLTAREQLIFVGVISQQQI